MARQLKKMCASCLLGSVAIDSTEDGALMAAISMNLPFADISRLNWQPFSAL